MSTLAIWGIVWSISEGVLFSLQLAGIATNTTLGYFILVLFIVSIVVGALTNWPLRTITKKIIRSGVKIKIKFGDIWKQPGEKIIGVTRCFSATVDDVIIHSNSLHGMFIKRNFTNTREAKIRIDTELGRTSDNMSICYEPGKTIKIDGSKDRVFLVGLTTLDLNNRASVTPEEYFIALGNMWETIKNRNGGQELICPLIGSGRARLNFNNAAIFYELLNSALITMKTGFLTNDLIFVIHPKDVENGNVDITELENVLSILCELENLKRISFEGNAREITF